MATMRPAIQGQDARSQEHVQIRSVVIVARCRAQPLTDLNGGKTFSVMQFSIYCSTLQSKIQVDA